MSEKLRLPDCDATDVSVTLTDAEKRELVKVLAAGGVEALDAYVADKSGEDSSIARKVAAVREELLRRAKELRERLAGKFAADKEDRVAAYEREHAALEEARRALEDDLREVRGGVDHRVGAASLEVDLVRLALDAASKPTPWWRRTWLAALSVLRWLLGLLLTPLAWLTGRRRHGRVKGRRAILERRGLRVDLSTARADPSLRRAVRNRLRSRPARERIRDAWRRLLEREDYEETVQRLMDDALRDEERRVQADVDATSRAFEEKLAALASREQEEKEALDRALERLEREKQEAEAALREEMEREPLDRARDDVISALEDAGLLRMGAGGWTVTERLVDRFAELVLAEETQKLGTTRGRRVGAWADGDGIWVRGQMQSVHELSHMDLLGSAVRARTRTPRGRDLHLYDDDVVVYREERGALHHVIIVFDRSGSMEENDRMVAAKRAVLALHRAVKRDNAANRVDVLAMDTSVERVDLVGAWESEPRGFTNTGGALKKAGDLLRASRAERGLVYLITDGLPEAYTEDGEDVAGRPEKALAYALAQARGLKRHHAVDLAVILLEVDDPLYVEAAHAIAREVDGRVFDARPEDLAARLLKDYDARATPEPGPRAR